MSNDMTVKAASSQHLYEDQTTVDSRGKVAGQSVNCPHITDMSYADLTSLLHEFELLLKKCLYQLRDVQQNNHLKQVQLGVDLVMSGYKKQLESIETRYTGQQCAVIGDMVSSIAGLGATFATLKYGNQALSQSISDAASNGMNTVFKSTANYCDRDAKLKELSAKLMTDIGKNIEQDAMCSRKSANETTQEILNALTKIVDVAKEIATLMRSIGR